MTSFDSGIYLMVYCTTMPTRLTLHPTIAAFLVAKESEYLSPQTIDDHEFHLNRFARHLEIQGTPLVTARISQSECRVEHLAKVGPATRS